LPRDLDALETGRSRIMMLWFATKRRHQGDDRAFSAVDSVT
jgi:hypothetical protein